MATKSTGVVLAFLAILTVLTVPSGVVVGPQQQIAFAQGVEEDSGGGEEIPFDDVKVVDGEEVIEVGSEEGGGGEEETGGDDIFSLQSIFEFLAQFDLDDDEGGEGDDGGAGEEEDGDNGGEGEVQQNDNNVEQQDSDTTQTRTQTQTETNVIVDREVQG